ncbi:hypothetical protein ACIBAC_03510 [Streptomyces sp. NPDC051362]|uniref:hypothetical protein n=1 Tax=Streptomyces sp. NPDC051362 TaxID=3365651 RepID=UPI0037936277
MGGSTASVRAYLPVRVGVVTKLDTHPGSTTERERGVLRARNVGGVVGGTIGSGVASDVAAKVMNWF